MAQQTVQENILSILTGDCTVLPENPAMTFTYQPDHFQVHAFHAIERNEDVIVTAHTGSGKTTVAEYAIMRAIQNGKIAVYTAPIKSLSNEKFNDFRTKFGDKDNRIDCGILTGDNKINPNGNCLIMTAEILRNALYQYMNPEAQKQTNQNNQGDTLDFVENIGVVIMDEIHFMNDQDRGRVWEETIMMLNSDVQLIGLSATINNSEQFASWIATTRKRRMNLIPTSFRVVPLHHYMYIKSSLIPILEKETHFDDKNFLHSHESYKKYQEERRKRFKSGPDYTQVNELIKFLQKKDMLQAIFFSFSKKSCEKYALMVTEQLITHDEARLLTTIFNKYLEKYDENYIQLDQYKQVKELLLRGVAYHHAGLMPILKEVIEILFKQGLIKVLFATETFAVGVNMPTRTVVFTELSKYTNGAKRNLTTAEYKQMSGRAGRRGIDKIGNVIILPIYNFPDDLKSIMLGKVLNIESRFKIDYQFVLKALQSGISTKDFISKSMAYSENMFFAVGLKREIEEKETQFKDMSNDFFSDVIELYRLEHRQENDIFQLSKSQMKKLNELKRKVNKDEYQAYINYQNMEQELFNLRERLWSCENDLEDTIGYVRNILMANGYVTKDQPTVKGVIAARINECNPILLTEMLVNGFFDDLTAEEIVGLLSIFGDNDSKYNDDEADEYLAYYGTPKIEKIIDQINDIAIRFVNDEMKFKYNSGNIWEITKDMIEAAYRWASGKSFNEIQGYLPTNMYIGNFIRSMIKINNIVNDLLILSEIAGKIDLIPRLSSIEAMIMREFVTVNSLYLS